MAKTTGLSVIELSSEFERTEPDVVVTVADRFETLGTAIASSYMNIPLAHTQGGEVSGSIDEKVRHSITKLADLHFPATERAQDFLIRMGEPREKVFLTGCPSIDLAAQGDLTLSADFFGRAGGVGATVDTQQPYIVVSQHPVTTSFADASAQIRETLLACMRMRDEGFQIVWLWPNIDAGSDRITKTLRSFRETEDSRAFHFYKNFGPEDYLKLIYNSACLIGNSSSGIRESAFLGIPAVNIGGRQALRERGPNVVDVDYNSEAIESACRSQVSHGNYASSQLFGDGTAGEQIAKILRTVELSHTKSLNYLDS
jgi:UDP-hydrolysing UDP-N-acetyl-D-glucosamine 2-epimerase